MPPKKPPPRRGAAAAVKTEPQSEAPPQDQAQASAGAEAAISVESTPQATPSGTPAGTPAPSNPAVQRAGTAAGRAGSSTPAGRGRPAVAKPKFAGRRSQKSRAELEKEEADRRKEENEKKAKEDARNRRRDAARGRGAFRGRQRGGYMGESERKVPDAPVMSGPFSLGQVSSDSSARRSAPGWAARSGGGGGGGGSGGSGGGYGGGGFKQEGSRGVISDVMMTDGPNIKAEDGGYISSDDDDDEDTKGMQKRNVDEMAAVDLTGGDGPNAGAGGGFAPVRVQRVEHKDRTVALNADGVSTKDGSAAKAQARDGSPEARRGKQKAKDVEVTGEQHKYKGTYSESSSEQGDEPTIKEEPTDDTRPTTPQPPEPPAHDAANLPEVPLQSPVSSPESRRKTKDRIKNSSDRPDFQTNEEQTEWELHQKDLRILRNELGRLSTKDKDADGDAAMEGAEAQQPQDDPRADKVYLFQFPPVLPDLIHKQIKPDPEAPTADAEPTDAAPPTNASNQLQSAEPESSGNTHTFNPGRVGKLRIHKSGRATLDWGGTPLEMGMGTEASFLQDVLIANFNKNDEGKIDSGTAMAMGQVKGKFVVTPDWDEILG
ncbi:hypothetical protein Q7P37_001611 [Cladosporium fusiforme]